MSRREMNVPHGTDNVAESLVLMCINLINMVAYLSPSCPAGKVGCPCAREAAAPSRHCDRTMAKHRQPSGPSSMSETKEKVD